MAFYFLPLTLSLKRARTLRGLMHFVAAALPKAPIHAHKLGDRTSLTAVPRGHRAGIMRARSSSAVVPPVRCVSRLLDCVNLVRTGLKGQKKLYQKICKNQKLYQKICKAVPLKNAYLKKPFIFTKKYPNIYTFSNMGPFKAI